jgi:hypothetical protein
MNSNQTVPTEHKHLWVIKMARKSLVLLPLIAFLIGYNSSTAQATSLISSLHTRHHIALARFDAQPIIDFAAADIPGYPGYYVAPSAQIIHDNEPFRVQWAAKNVGQTVSPAFTDQLVITSIPEGCPGSDDTTHAVIFDSKSGTDQLEYQEQPLAPGATGNLVQPFVGPFSAGAYRLTVNLAEDLGIGSTTFNCINIIPALT